MSLETDEKLTHSEILSADEESKELAEILEPDFEAENAEDDEDENVVKRDYAAEIIAIIRGNDSPKIVKEKLEDYHENDIAEVLDSITPNERRKLYRLLDKELLSDIFEHTESDEAGLYLSEMDIKKAASIISLMETDSAVTILRTITEKEKRSIIIDLLDDEAKENIAIIASFDEDEIGSKMSTNYICISDSLSIKEAMRSLVEQAEKNDNISTIFVVDDEGIFCGAIDLKDLIIAREGTDIHDVIITSFPYVYGAETITDCIEKLKDYSENSIPVLDNSNRILGIITSQSIVDVIDDEMGEDYAKLAGLTAEEDLNEPVKASMTKRLPWLFALLGIGILISTIVGTFEGVVAALPLVMAFQSLILGMAGNAGTQSLAVTIRVLMDENLDIKDKTKLVLKEVRVGFMNGLILGTIAFVALGLYIMLIKGQSLGNSFLISGCAGVSLMCAMTFASFVGTMIPLFFKKIKVDPAVASGPFISSISDLVAVITYYGLCALLLINIFRIA